MAIIIEPAESRSELIRSSPRGEETSGDKRFYGDISERADERLKGLLLEQAGVAGDALPLAHIEDPRIGEAADVIVRLAFIRSLCVVDSGDHRRISKKIHFHI
jgi:hypothetical protein